MRMPLALDTLGRVVRDVASCRTSGLLPLVAIFGLGASAHAQNAIVTATQAPPITTRSGLFAAPVYGYGSPYGTYPYQSFNPSTQAINNPQPNANSSVPGQPQQPGQTQTQASQQGLQAFQGGGGGGGNGGSGGGAAGSGGGGGQGAPGGSAAEGASYEVLQNPNSPLYKRYERHDAAQQQLRPEILTQIGRGKGVRRGFIEESQRIARSVDANAAARLDARYDFSRQMIGNHLVPPVIGEIHHVEERAGDRVLYLTVGAYQIVRPARLVLSPPNWRDYLVVDPADPQTSISALAPGDSTEQALYDKAYDAGLAKGVQEARDTFEDNLNRLERDYSGMERYHELERQGAVSLPVVNDSKRAVRLADNGQRAFIGEQVVTLRISPRFKAARQGAFK